ncbi:hypothetical protein KP001_08995 [Geomonas subterranea]|uniref:ATP-binding protein n=1 Tax=Geomonas subterranea TaxID=2847989 RepID=A0ABX8LQR0_9BACT|nr:hypothetical protein [Geomonas subterranea]QXE92634.1 hypothetical protein KP001_08995 [Geomonas subterranea]QXM09267.1 hypothetical protein KP002_20280 [Geomonas subterranea]
MSKKTSNHRKLNKAQGIIYSSNKPHTAIARYFNELSAKEIYLNFSTIYNHRFFHTLISFYADKNQVLERFGSVPSTDTLKSLYWGLGLFEKHSQIIKTFIRQEGELTKALLESDFGSCIQILDEIDNDLGISTWSISTRCSIYTLAGNTDQKRDFIKDIGDKSNINSFFFAIANNVSLKYDDSEVLASDLSSLETQIKRHVKGELLDFLLYKLCLKNFDYQYNYDNILNVEKNMSIIDFYIACVDCLVFCIFDEQDNGDIKFILKRLATLFESTEIKYLANHYGIKTEWKFSKDYYELLDLYTKGAYADVIVRFKNDPSYEFQIFELVAKSAARSSAIETSGLKKRIIDSLVTLTIKSEKYERSLGFLVNLCHGFSALRYFRELHLFVENESKLLSHDRSVFLNKIRILFSGISSPRKIDIMDSDILESYTSTFREIIGQSIAWTFYSDKNDSNLLQNITVPIESNRLIKYLSKTLIRDNQHIDAIPLLNGLIECEDILIKQEASRLLVDCYLKTGDTEGALNEFAIRCIKNPFLITNYDTSLICEKAIEAAKFSSSLYIPISLSLHSNYVNDKYLSALRYAFENYLLKNKIDFPLNGLKCYEKYPEFVADYFLTNVCVPDTMKLYFGFETSKDIDYHRINICNFLIEKNLFNKQSLVHEVKELTKKLVISDAIKCVENSKIYSDSTIFYSEVGKKKLENLFNKIQELRRQDFSDYDDEVEFKGIYNSLKQQGIIDRTSRSVLVLTGLNEKNASFLNLLQRMRDDFTFGDKGLNTYLSTRIRHGYLPTMIRKSVVNQNLLSQIDPYKKTYCSNEYWLNKLNGLEDKVSKKLDLAFTEFSKSFENKISEINDNWLQIYFLDQNLSTLGDKISKTESLFNYSIFNLEAYVLQQKIPLTASYSELIKYVVDWLWERTDSNLLKVRDKLSIDAKKAFLGYLDKLQYEVYELLHGKTFFSELNDAIARARTDLSNNIDQLITWFTRSNENTVPQYDIEIAVEIAKRTACIALEFEKDKDYKLQGWTLTHFVDFLYILMENAISKSRVSKENLGLKISLSTVDGTVVLEIVNNCSLDETLENANSRVEYYRVNYGKDTVGREGIQSEGGTGFFKIWNILFRVLNITHLVDFKHCNDGTFAVKFVFYNFKKVLFYENINS